MTPEDFRNPFSSMFRDKLADMSDKIDRLLERASQIDKLAAEIERFNGGGEAVEASGVSFFTIFEVSEDELVDCVAGLPPYQAYRGQLYEIGYNETNDCYERINLKTDAIGFDFVQPNWPDEYPSSVSTLSGDLLDPLTTVMVSRVNDTAFFSSVIPRLSVECIE